MAIPATHTMTSGVLLSSLVPTPPILNSLVMVISPYILCLLYILNSADTCFITSRPTAHDWRTGLPVARLRSPWSGIQIDVFSDQDAFQVYTCGGQNGTVALKSTQGLFDNPDRPRVVPQYGCIVMEVQDYIDGINHPEWGRSKKQIFGPGDDPYVLQASYRFSLNGTKVGSDGSG